MKKRAIKFSWQKQEVTPVKTVLESPGFFVYYYLTNAFSVSTDRGTSLAVIYVVKLNIIKKI